MGLRAQDFEDTIVAQSTAEGLAAIGVVRLSGPAAKKILIRIFRQQSAQDGLPARQLVRGWVENRQGQAIDDVLAVFFPGPGSYTGQDLAEIHCHGGPTVLATIIDLLLAEGARPARPGEFTRRAFESGKMDLSAAEAVVQLIHAGSQAQLVGACRSLSGELTQRLDAVLERLETLQAHLEAKLDFSDEQDSQQISLDACHGLQAEIAAMMTVVRRVDVYQDEVVFCGRPNVGKSSLINRLAGRSVSIVSPEPGTTRDAVSAQVQLAGQRVSLVDTAGHRQNENLGPIDRQAGEVAQAKMEAAAVRVWVSEVKENVASPPPEAVAAHLWVANKADLLADNRCEAVHREVEAKGGLLVSALSGDGLERMAQEIAKALCGQLGPVDGIPMSCRQQAALEKMAAAGQRAEKALGDEMYELAAEDVKDAIAAVGELKGREIETDVLDRIFGEFCIGK